MKEIKAIIEPSLVQRVLAALEEIPGLPGVVLSEVTICRSATDTAQGVKQTSLEIVVPTAIAAEVVDAISRTAHWEDQRDGRIFVTNVDAASIRDIEAGVA